MLATSFVEIGSHPIGPVWREQDGCRFFAASQLTATDNQSLPSVDAATAAAATILVSLRAKLELGPLRKD